MVLTLLPRRPLVSLTITLLTIVCFMVLLMRLYSTEHIKRGRDTMEEHEISGLKPYIKSYTKIVEIPQRKTDYETVRTYSQAGQDKTVYEILPVKNGFFVEIGALDGITFSNTLWLERKHGWTGLLIEANPELCNMIDKLKRLVWRLCACISEQKQHTFIQSGAVGGVSKLMNDKVLSNMNTKHSITVPCFRLQTVMKYLKRTRINYFSLDVEGAEMYILETIKDDLKSNEIVVDIWTIEYRVWNGTKKLVNDSLQNLQNLRRYFEDVGGYFEHSQLSNDGTNQDGLALDVVFVKIKTWCTTHKTLPNGQNCQ